MVDTLLHSTMDRMTSCSGYNERMKKSMDLERPGTRRIIRKYNEKRKRGRRGSQKTVKVEEKKV